MSTRAARLTERPRELQEVELVMVDRTHIRGMLHWAHGSRTADFLNRQAEAFVAGGPLETSRVDIAAARGETRC